MTDSRHDFSLIEEALANRRRVSETATKQIEDASRRLTALSNAEAEKSLATTRASTMIAGGKRAIMFSCAIALVLVAAGFAWKISHPAMLRANEQTAAVVAPSPMVPEGVTVRNYSLFTDRMVSVSGGREFVVKAGHEYAKSGDTQFTSAWCYLDGVGRSGEQLNLRLGNLKPGEAPVPISDPSTQAALSLSTNDTDKLFSECPWLDAGPTNPTHTNLYTFSGEVTDVSVSALLRAIEGGARSIELDSPGGDIQAAIRAFDAIRERNISTFVSKGCYSACSVIFAAGTVRQVAAGAELGVHQWVTSEGNASDEEAQLTGAELADRFDAAGIEPQLFITASRTRPDQMHVLTRAELEDWNVVTADS